MTPRPRVAVSASFLAFGITVGGLIPRVPALKDHLHLTDGQVGVALLGASLGGVTGALVSRLIIRRGARRYARAGTFALSAAAVGPGLASNLVELMVSLYVIGFFWGFVDVLENAMGAQLERTEGRPLINGFHGFWSLGALSGSLVAGGAAFVGVAPALQFVGTGVIGAVVAAWLLRDLPELVVAPPHSWGDAAQRRRDWPEAMALTSAVVAVAAMSFTGIIAEGGTSDWSALYLRELTHTNQGVAAAGFSGFSLAAMLVRFRADLLTARTSRVSVARIGAMTAVAGLALVIAVPTLPAAAIAGFTLVGMGTAVALPLAFAAGANLGRTGTALAVVMASAYAGSIAGPPLIGAAADHFGLRLAMAIPLVAALAVLLLAGSLAAGFPDGRPPRGRGGTRSEGARNQLDV